MAKTKTKTKTKTIKQWFMEDLPEEIGHKAIWNVIDQGKESNFNRKAKSLDYAIIKAFSWAKTEQGMDYWYNLYIKYGGKP